MEGIKENTKPLVRVEVSKANLKNNLETLKKISGGNRKIALCIKGNAYGHGLYQIAQFAQEEKIDYICITNINEAIYLHKEGIKLPMILMGYLPENAIPLLDILQIVPLIESIKTAQLINEYANKIGKKLAIHLNIDTGMHREGFTINEDIESILRQIYALTNVKVDAIATHFIDSDNLSDSSLFSHQFETFLHVQKIAITVFPQKIDFYCSNSAAILAHPEAHFDILWPGLCFYGYYPSKQIEDHCKNSTIFLKSALQLKTEIISIRTIQEGETVGYNQTYISMKKTRVATLPIGYYDGIDRKLSNNGYVIVLDKKAPIIGTINMNVITIDITNIPQATLKTEVTVIGNTAHHKASIQELSEKIGTINYEILARLGSHIFRSIK